jgi:hypothetical protein
VTRGGVGIILSSNSSRLSVVILFDTRWLSSLLDDDEEMFRRADDPQELVHQVLL